jgi:uncharacterized protein with GYD domain
MFLGIFRILSLAGVSTAVQSRGGAGSDIRKFYYQRAGKGSRMAIYVMLGNLKRAAFEQFNGIEERDLKAKKVVESLGGKLISLYYTFGRYDFVVVIDMPSKENMVKFLSIIAKFGTVRTQTLETIPADMFYKIAKEV